MNDMSKNNMSSLGGHNQNYSSMLCRRQVETILPELDPEGTEQRRRRRFKRGIYTSLVFIRKSEYYINYDNKSDKQGHKG